MSELDRHTSGGPWTDGQWRARRRIAGRRLAVRLGVALSGQAASGALAGDHKYLAGPLVSGFALVFSLAVGLLVPRPPGGFRWTWREPPAGRRSPDPGFDVLGLVATVGPVLLWLVTNAWLQDQELPWLPYSGLALGFVLTGSGLSVGVIELRRRHDRRRQAAPPRLVELQQRPREQGP